VGPEEKSFSRDRWLVVVTVVVLCPLQICVISNGHLPVTFLGLFVTLVNGRIARYQRRSTAVTKASFSRSVP
jgi:hypothetical protein